MGLNQSCLIYRDIILDSETMEKVKEMEGHKGVRKQKKSYKKWVVKNAEDFRRRISGFALFTRQQEIFPIGFGRTVEEKKQLVSAKQSFVKFHFGSSENVSLLTRKIPPNWIVPY